MNPDTIEMIEPRQNTDSGSPVLGFIIAVGIFAALLCGVYYLLGFEIAVLVGLSILIVSD